MKNIILAIILICNLQSFQDLTDIFIVQNPKRGIDYCKCLAATAVNEMNDSHTKYTERIWKHNPRTITKGIRVYNEIIWNLRKNRSR